MNDPTEAARALAAKLRERNGGMVATWEAADAIDALLAEIDELEEKIKVAREALSVIANKEMAAAGSRAATRLIAREALAKIGEEHA